MNTHSPTKQTRRLQKKNTPRHEVNADEDKDKAHHQSTSSIFISTHSPTATRNSFSKPFSAANPSRTHTLDLGEHIQMRTTPRRIKGTPPPESKIRISFVLIAAYVAGGTRLSICRSLESPKRLPRNLSYLLSCPPPPRLILTCTSTDYFYYYY